MRRALSEYVVTGIRTNLAFHQRLLELPPFVDGQYHTGTLEQFQEQLLRGTGDLDDAEARTLAVALACAVAKTEAAGAGSLGQPDPTAGGTGLSPWVLTHRMRSMG